MPALVTFENVTKEFPASGAARASGPTFRAVDAVDLEIHQGDITGVIGYSGAGKSTLVRLINALERPTSGRVVVDGTDITALNERELRAVRGNIGMIFQQFNLFSSRTVAQNVAYPLKLAGRRTADRERRVNELLAFVNIADKAGAYPNQLSGGQKQRVGIARALATAPAILLADEATSALDPNTTSEVLDLLKKVNAELGTTIVVITHEMDVVRTICDRVIVMERGQVVEQGPVYDVFARPQSAAAGQFVRTSLKDRPSAETIERFREVHTGRIVTVTIQEEGGLRTAIFDRLRASNVRSTVIYGGISELADRPFGSLTFEFAGTDREVDDLVAALSAITAVDEWPRSEDASGASR